MYAWLFLKFSLNDNRDFLYADSSQLDFSVEHFYSTIFHGIYYRMNSKRQASQLMS